MFQMSKQLFDQCWPAIAALMTGAAATGSAPALFDQCRPAISALLGAKDEAAPPGGAQATPSAAAATEANYVLGVAMGYALRVDLASGPPARPMVSALADGRLRRIRVSPVADRTAQTPARNDQKSTLTLRRATR
ncbi:MAG: hypothetical protein U1A72_11560 [Sulfuritalea sp.]|nr:hypothetical protein [Sulfuritalea sp.]